MKNAELLCVTSKMKKPTLTILTQLTLIQYKRAKPQRSQKIRLLEYLK